jgi:hypothetical protein
MQYVVRKRGCAATPSVAPIAHFHSASSDHRPRTTFSMEYDDAGIYIAFNVADQYVLCRRTERQAMVCKDSCVEAFLQPKPDKGYFNFETNCGGAILVFYVTDPRPAVPAGLSAFELVADDLLDLVRIEHSMPASVPVEIATPVEWSLSYFVPNELLERYVGPLEPPSQRRWRGNFFKCADESSHPAWASWNPIGAELNFHTPQNFGDLIFV